MSTRSNICVKYGSTKVYLYRHCDGYPAYNGVAIAAALAKSNNATQFLTNILAKKYPKTEYSPARPIYEVTSGWHGDIEWAYTIEFPCWENHKDGPKIGVMNIRFDENRETTLASLEYDTPNLTLQQFTDYVKHERAEYDKRVRAYKKSQGKK